MQEKSIYRFLKKDKRYPKNAMQWSWQQQHVVQQVNKLHFTNNYFLLTPAFRRAVAPWMKEFRNLLLVDNVIQKTGAEAGSAGRGCSQKGLFLVFLPASPLNRQDNVLCCPSSLPHNFAYTIPTILGSELPALMLPSPCQQQCIKSKIFLSGKDHQGLVKMKMRQISEAG